VLKPNNADGGVGVVIRIRVGSKPANRHGGETAIDQALGRSGEALGWWQQAARSIRSSVFFPRGLGPDGQIHFEPF